MSSAINSDNLPDVPVIFGTAGHIDHGKSSLIKALTGSDPDRLKEEKQRGITIELGFAFLNEKIAFIDVPGHEKFIKHMVAGAATVDYAILVVAADDGVMPQTREHLDILNLLGVTDGMVVVTKADMAEDDWIEMVKEDIHDLLLGTALDKAEIHVVDSLSGRGLEEVRSAILKMAATKKIQGGSGLFRMPIDRVFTVKGFGTVVTGSILSGSIAVGDSMDVLPSHREIRIKGIQSQGKSLERAIAGQRAAINLHALAVTDIERGDVLVTKDALEPTRFLDAKLSLLKSSPAPLKHRQRVRLHMGCAEIFARVVLLIGTEMQPGEEGFVQLHLESPTVTQRLDRFVIRRYSPQITIGGGIVLDAHPPRHKRNKSEVTDALARLASTDDKDLVIAALEKTPFITSKNLALSLSQTEEETAAIVEDLLLSGELMSFETGKNILLCTDRQFEESFEKIKIELAKYHEMNPLRAGLRQGDLLPRVKNKAYPKPSAALILEKCLELGVLKRPGGDLLALQDFAVKLSKAERRKVDQLLKTLAKGGLKPEATSDIAVALDIKSAELKVLLTYLVDIDKVLCLEKKFFFAMDAINHAKQILLQMFNGKNELTLSEIKEQMATSRKFAVPLLTYFDDKGFTIRQEDVRIKGDKLTGE